MISRLGVRGAACAVAIVLCTGAALWWSQTRGSSGQDLKPGGFSYGSDNELKSGGFSHESDTPSRIDLADLGTSILVENGTKIDFGEVKLGEPLSHTIEVMNIGPGELALAKLKMNCACNAQVEYERDVCRPGEIAGIQISTKAVGYGLQRKPIPFAISHDGHLETLFTLDMRYRVAWLEQSEFVPKRLELGEISATAGVDREVELVLIGPPDGPAPVLTELESDATGVHAELVRGKPVGVNAKTARTIPAQRVLYTVRVVVDPQQVSIGKLHGHVTAQTSIGEAKLHVTGELCRPVVASPASLLVSKSRETETRQVIRIRRPGEWNRPVEKDRPAEAIVLVSASATTPGVSCVVDNERHQVEVHVAPGAKLFADAAVTILAKVGDVDESLSVPLVEF